MPSLLFNPALEGLRGVAITLVLVFHAIGTLLPGGFIGVDIFFVLSGFLITRILVDEHNRHQQLKLGAFYIRRALRLMPALLFMLGSFCLAVFITQPPEQSALLWGEALYSGLYLTNWARAFDLYTFQFLGHTWSLAIEEQFYILWPWLLHLLLKLRLNSHQLAGLLLIVALIFAAWRAYLFYQGTTPMRVYNGLDTRADGLLLGSALAIYLPLLDQPTVKKAGPWLRYCAVFSLAILGSIAYHAEWYQPWMIYGGYTLVSLLSACLIAELVNQAHGPLQTFFCLRPLRWLGLISYGLYLWHFPIYCILLKTGYSPWQTLFAGTILSLLAASLSFYLIEKPCLALKKRYSP